MSESTARTTEQRTAFTQLRALAVPSRYRVVADSEGWPILPGRYGQVEWYDGQVLAVWCDRPRLFLKLLAIPGVQRWQMGDREVRVLVPVEGLEAVAGILRLRRRRPPGSAAHLPKVGRPTYRVTSAA